MWKFFQEHRSRIRTAMTLPPNRIQMSVEELQSAADHLRLGNNDYNPDVERKPQRREGSGSSRTFALLLGSGHWTDAIWSVWRAVTDAVWKGRHASTHARSARLKRIQSSPPPRTRITQAQVDERKKQLQEGSGTTPAFALFRDADLRDLDLSGVAWAGEDFTNCDLRGANLSGCDFAGAKFERAELWNADLSGSDLTGVTKLFPAQLAATNLKGAKLPDSLAKFEALAASAELADNASKVFLTILGAVAFTFLTLATTTDAQLITNTSNTKLPVIGTDVAIQNFYWAIPIVLLVLFTYFHLSLQRLWEALATLPAVFPDGRRLDERSHPWLLTDLARWPALSPGERIYAY